MAARKVILVGDTLSSGGNVLAKETAFVGNVNGKPMAPIGGPAYCDACQSTGTIFKSGGPYRMTFNGTGVALVGDLVHCKCPTPPSLVSTQSMSWLPTVDDQEESLGVVKSYSRQFKLVDSTGAPMADTYYTAMLQSNERVHGITNENGLTERYFFDAAHPVEIHIGHLPSDDSA